MSKMLSDPEPRVWKFSWATLEILGDGHRELWAPAAPGLPLILFDAWTVNAEHHLPEDMAPGFCSPTREDMAPIIRVLRNLSEQVIMLQPDDLENV